MAHCETGLLFSPGEEPTVQSDSWKSFILVEDKKKKKKDLTLLYCYSEFVRAGGGKKCPVRVRMKGRSLHGLLTRFGKGLCGTWPDKEIKRLTQKVPQSTALS